MISENNILLISRGKTFLKENTWQNKISTLKKYLSWRIMLGINPTPSSGKKFYHDRFGEKILTQSKSPRPPPKSQIVGPKIVVFFSFFNTYGFLYSAGFSASDYFCCAIRKTFKFKRHSASVFSAR